MTEHQGPPETPDPATSASEPSDRLAAHERLSTGALSTWTRACANHPWRVVFSWIGIIAALIVLVATVGGSLKDEFDDSRLRDAEGDRPARVAVRVRAGSCAQHRLRRSRGRTARHARAQGGDQEGHRAAEVARIQACRRQGRPESVGDPFSEDTFSDNGRIAYAEAQFDQTIEDKDRDQVVAVEDAVREDGRAGGRHRRVQRRSRVPADRARNFRGCSGCSPRSSCC